MTMKFGLIACEDSPVWGGQVGCGEYLLSRFAVGKSASEHWVPIYAVERQLPSGEELKSFKGFIISGAHFSVNDDEEWIRDLEVFVRAIYMHNEMGANKIHVYGICFGHQLIAKALGGKVALNEKKNFIFGAERVTVKKTLRERKFFLDVFGSNSELIMMESHGKCVTEIPEGACLLGSSASCKAEILMYSDFILTSQGHPEFTKDVMVKNIVPKLRTIRKWTEDQVNEALAAMDLAETDNCVKMVRAFLISPSTSY